MLHEVLNDSEIVIAGDHPRSRFLALRFAERGARVTLLPDPGADGHCVVARPRAVALARRAGIETVLHEGGRWLRVRRPVAGERGCRLAGWSALVWPTVRKAPLPENLCAGRRNRNDPAGRNRRGAAPGMPVAASQHLASLDGKPLRGPRVADGNKRSPGLGNCWTASPW